MIKLNALRPVATATPDGVTQIVRPYRWIPERTLAEINRVEEAHRKLVRETADRIAAEREQREIAEAHTRFGNGSGQNPVTVSSRRAVKAEVGHLGYMIRPGASRNHESRTHSRAKTARRPDRRTIRQLPLAI